MKDILKLYQEESDELNSRLRNLERDHISLSREIDSLNQQMSALNAYGDRVGREYRYYQENPRETDEIDRDARANDREIAQIARELTQNESWQQDVESKIDSLTSQIAQKVDQIREIERSREIAEAPARRKAEEERIAQELEKKRLLDIENAKKEQERQEQRKRDEEYEKKANRKKAIQKHFHKVFPAIMNRDSATIIKAINAGALDGENALPYLGTAAGLGYKEICELLIGCGARIDGKDEEGNTPLHNAIRGSFGNSIEIHKWLIGLGAKIDAQNNDGQTPLHEAVKKGRAELCELLIDLDPNLLSVKDNIRRTALDLVAHSSANQANKIRITKLFNDKASELQRQIIEKEERMLAQELAMEDKARRNRSEKITHAIDKVKGNWFGLMLYLEGENAGNDVAKDLADAFKTNDRITPVFLGKNNISDSGAKALAEALKTNTTIIKLDLSENQISSNGAKYFADALETNHTLLELDLSYNPIPAGDENLARIKTALERNRRPQFYKILERVKNNDPTITSIALPELGIGDLEFANLAKALRDNTFVSQISLRNNNIGTSVALALAKVLKTNKNLKKVDLWSNKIGEAGARAFAEALVTNHTLLELDLRYNQIPAEDKNLTKIKTALERNKQLAKTKALEDRQEQVRQEELRRTQKLEESKILERQKEELKQKEITQRKLEEEARIKIEQERLQSQKKLDDLRIKEEQLRTQRRLEEQTKLAQEPVRLRQQGNKLVVDSSALTTDRPKVERIIPRPSTAHAKSGITTPAIPHKEAEAKIFAAAKAGDIQLLQESLASADAVNMRNEDGKSPLHIAVKHNKKDACVFLLSHSAEISAKDTAGNTALHLAGHYGYKKICKLLIDREAHINERNSKLETPLHMAARNANKEICELFLAHGADIFARDKKDRIAIEVIGNAGGLTEIAKQETRAFLSSKMEEIGMLKPAATNDIPNTTVAPVRITEATRPRFSATLRSKVLDQRGNG